MGSAVTIESPHDNYVWAATFLVVPILEYRADELRKQVEPFIGCIILTAHGNPETKNEIRAYINIYKNTLPAAGIAGRTPYGINAHILEVVNWERVRLHKLMSCTGVSDARFPAILNRLFVWEPQARFMDALYREQYYAQHAMDGVFPKSQDLRILLVDGTAIATCLQTQYGLALNRNGADCLRMLERAAPL